MPDHIPSENPPGEELDPVDVEPTDNSSGAPVDLDAVEEVEAEARDRS